MKGLRFLLGILVVAGVAWGVIQGASLLGRLVRVDEPPQPIFWFIVLDTSASTTSTVNPNWFEITRKKMIPEVVLSRLRARDEVAIVPLDDRADDADARSFYLQPQLSYRGEMPQVARIRKEIETLRIRGAGDRGGTDFGGAIRYIDGNVRRVRGERGGEAPRFVACFFTDGFADGRQAKSLGEQLPEEVELVVWGTADRSVHPSMQRVFADSGVDLARVPIYPFGDWESAARTWGAAYDRPQNATHLK